MEDDFPGLSQVQRDWIDATIRLDADHSRENRIAECDAYNAAHIEMLTLDTDEYQHVMTLRTLYEKSKRK